MIQRDGALTSLWQGTVDPYQSSNLPNHAFYDVVIAGGGITGISLGLQLQQAGLQCLVVEANNLGFGTTGGTTAHLNTLLDTPYNTIIRNFDEEKASLVARAARAAITLIQDTVKRYGIECGFEYNSAYLFAQDAKQEKELNDIVDACGKVGVAVSYTDAIPVGVGFTKAIEIPEQAKFSPLQYVYAIAKVFEEAGGVIVERERVISYTSREDEVTGKPLIEVQTNNHTYIAGNLVFATHIPPGINILHFRCAPYRSYAMAVKLANNDYPAGLCYDMYEPYHYYRTQQIGNDTYFIAGGEDHKTAHEENTESCFNRLEAHVRKHFNVAEVVHKWSSQYYEPVDGLPYIGSLPGASGNVFAATGYGGNGITYSQVATLVLTDLITKGNSMYAGVFDPGRVKPVAGFTNFVKENTDVVKHLVGKLFSVKELESLADLANGEGRVIKYNDHKVALYKDDAGKLHAVDPTCTHAKCNVSWNIAEQSWDCPCHGARYTMNGIVLNGPSVEGLKKIDLKEE
jgi:glycine/D-amino acid oxidase-like deaminating enzyme/nitrite reductase/ring-hydroxylating ferredoxin subunit